MLLSRRDFLHTGALASAALATSHLAPAASAAAPASITAGARWKIIGFTKPFLKYSPEETADLVADVGWDGVECPVRVSSGQIAPERVEEDLPRMAEALKKRGKEITIVTTEIVQVTPLAEKILRTTAKLGIKQYRLGFTRYKADRPIADTLRETAAAFRDLAALNRELGLQGGWQNHSGADYVGGPIWDLQALLKDIDPRQLGVCYDVAHATVEGGLVWPLHTRLIQPHIVALFVKDFFWEKGPRGWAPRWCPLGDGMAPRRFYEELKRGGLTWTLSQHHEYKEIGSGPTMVAHLKKDLATLRSWLG